ncbi:MAG: plastocyanin/azurin family copper-binding protein [Actinomycetota bacterium]
MNTTRLRASVPVALLLLVGGGAVWGGVLDTGVRTVEVLLRYSHFEPDVITVEPGETVRFVVHNGDPIDHEFIIGDAAVQRAHERGTESFHAPRPGEMTVPAGATRETTYTFPPAPATLILGCHLPSHYAYGMRAAITVG